MERIAGAFSFGYQRFYWTERTGGVKISRVWVRLDTGGRKVGRFAFSLLSVGHFCLSLETFNGDRFAVVSLVQTYYDY